MSWSRRPDGPPEEVRPPTPEGWRPGGAIPAAPSDVADGVQLFPRTDRAADAALVDGLALDDPDAAAAFVRRFQGAVFGLAVSITRDRALAEDISQEVFVRAWRAAASYDIRRASVLTWLLTITRNAAIDAVRARRVAPTDADVLEQLVDATMRSPDPEEQALRGVDGERAARRLMELPPEQARAVVLATVGGLTAKEVGEHEGIPLGTAKTRIRTGLMRVRRAMEEERG
jgi:RNA polymerase sigma factor (sigma-70 family)